MDEPDTNLRAAIVAMFAARDDYAVADEAARQAAGRRDAAGDAAREAARKAVVAAFPDSRDTPETTRVFVVGDRVAVLCRSPLSADDWPLRRL